MQYVASILAVVVAGCGFTVPGASSGDGGPIDGPIDAPGDGAGDAPVVVDARPDAPPDAPPPPPTVAHVAAADEAMLTSTTDYVLTGTVTIDTTTGVVTPPVPAGVIVGPVMQDGGGLGLLVIQARSISVAAGAHVRITGNRGVVLVGTSAIAVTGILDASAVLQVPGAGGFPASNGPGAGPDALANNGWETGGAGASFGSVGGKAGDALGIPQTGPSGPPVYGSALLAALEGGSGGGDGKPASCTTGGAGGGALQLTAPTITIAGSVRASGGGGQGGKDCPGLNNASSGSGGGSGGAIYIEAGMLLGAGWLVANGGGGGGGGCGSCTDTTGDPGQDGAGDAMAALGGSSPLPDGQGDGGNGASSVAGAQPGSAGGNAGGGGGGGGRIYLAIPATLQVGLMSSPTAQR